MLAISCLVSPRYPAAITYPVRVLTPSAKPDVTARGGIKTTDLFAWLIYRLFSRALSQAVAWCLSQHNRSVIRVVARARANQTAGGKTSLFPFFFFFVPCNRELGINLIESIERKIGNATRRVFVEEFCRTRTPRRNAARTSDILVEGRQINTREIGSLARRRERERMKRGGGRENQVMAV